MCPTFPPGLIGDDILGATCERHWREVENKRACVIRNQADIDGTFGWVFNLIEGQRPNLGTVQVGSGNHPGLILHRRAIDTDQLPHHLRLCLQGRMDALGQGRKVRIKRTHHDTCVLGHSGM